MIIVDIAASFWSMKMLGLLDKRLQLGVVKSTLNWESENLYPLLIFATNSYETMVKSLKFSPWL